MPFAGGWLVTCYDKGSLVKIGADGKTEQVWDKDFDRRGSGWHNDETSDGRGGAYLTASGPWRAARSSASYHLTADGALTPVADDLHYANGIQLSADGKLLYVNELRLRASSPSRCRRTAVLPTGGCSSG